MFFYIISSNYSKILLWNKFKIITKNKILFLKIKKFKISKNLILAKIK